MFQYLAYRPTVYITGAFCFFMRYTLSWYKKTTYNLLSVSNSNYIPSLSIGQDLLSQERPGWDFDRKKPQFLTNKKSKFKCFFMKEIFKVIRLDLLTLRNWCFSSYPLIPISFKVVRPHRFYWVSSLVALVKLLTLLLLFWTA